MSERNLLGYLPPALQNVLEFQTIADVVQPEIEAAWDALSLVMENQFIDTASEAGVSIWEKELGIVPSTADALSDRKLRVKNAWLYGALYTYRWLVNYIGMFNAENTPPPTIEDYVLHTILPIRSNYEATETELRRRIPAAIAMDLTLSLSPVKNMLFYGIGRRTLTGIKIRSEQENIVFHWDCIADSNGDILTDADDKAVCVAENTPLLISTDAIL